VGVGGGRDLLGERKRKGMFRWRIRVGDWRTAEVRGGVASAAYSSCGSRGMGRIGGGVGGSGARGLTSVESVVLAQGEVVGLGAWSSGGRVVRRIGVGIGHACWRRATVTSWS
jgi:hypothetical protein